MELKPSCQDKIIQLIDGGVDIPNPLTLDIGEEVNVGQISQNGVKLYPGCRIYGEKTVIAEGAQIGSEGPVTVQNCQIGPKVELKGGYFKGSVFLEKANMGLGAHVREACILEEQANGAHCVGLKHTILFPFVTLGSLINFCDCLMAGGTSRKDHSEVGSSYIHFNFTPEGDKTTASLIGDVPRGVMLNQPAIFLGGQGGIVGPARLGYGNVVAAGTILRGDFPEDNKLIVGKSHRGRVTDFVPHRYSAVSRVVENNVLYLANLVALEQWYLHVRQSFFHAQELGELIYSGVLEKLILGKAERIKRLKAMAAKMPGSVESARASGPSGKGRRQFNEKVEEVCALFEGDVASNEATANQEGFLSALDTHKKDNGGDYLEVVQSLPAHVSEEGVGWLTRIVNRLCRQAGAMLPELALFKI